MILLLLACIHTPPHDPVEGTWTKEFVRLEEMRANGDYCSWEAESLMYGGAALWSVAPPIGENWCGTPAERAQYFDVLGQDGPFLSIRTQEIGCCPERSASTCVTWNLSTGKPATLMEYDERRAEKRWQKAQDIATAPAYAGLTIAEDTFVVKPGGHVAFCAAPHGGARSSEEIQEIVVK